MPNVIQVTPDNVRAAIDISLDASVLPDEIINLDIYAGAAILEVKRMDPLWADRVDEEAQHLDNAADYLTAARAVFAVPALTAEDYGGESYTRKALDPVVVSERMVALAGTEVTAATSAGAVDVTATRPTLFGTACGRRGR